MAWMKAVSRSLAPLGLALAIAGVIIASSDGPAEAAGGVSGTLRGTVVDQDHGNPVSGAKVTAVSVSGTFHAETDTHGFFVLLQVPTDTYALTIAKDGFLLQSIVGVTVLGDQTQSVGTVRLTPAAKQIGLVRVTAHAASSAFQPTQTVDETTFSGKRVDQALGEKGSTDYNQLVLSAPASSRRRLERRTRSPSAVRPRSRSATSSTASISKATSSTRIPWGTPRPKEARPRGISTASAAGTGRCKW